jgi:hypothetical protein
MRRDSVCARHADSGGGAGDAIEDFTFDATATTVTTPVTKVLAERRGCQDFALQISASVAQAGRQA